MDFLPSSLRANALQGFSGPLGGGLEVFSSALFATSQPSDIHRMPADGYQRHAVSLAPVVLTVPLGDHPSPDAVTGISASAFDLEEIHLARDSSEFPLRHGR
jgi:hypothetical protein